MNTPDVVAGICLLGVGASFLRAYYSSGDSKVFQALLWFCEKGSYPESRKMAFFYAGLFGVLGVIEALSGFGLIEVSG